MDVARGRKRKLEDDVCLLCGKADNGIMSKIGCLGFEKLEDAAKRRHDTALSDTLDRLCSGGDTADICYHKSCYASYTSGSHLPPGDLQSATSTTINRAILTRRDIHNIKLDVCIICEQGKYKGCSTLHQAAVKTVDAISNVAKTKELIELRRRLEILSITGNDVLYHTNCYRNFIRSTNTTASLSVPEEDLVNTEQAFQEVSTFVQNKIIENNEPTSMSKLYNIYTNSLPETTTGLSRRALQDRLIRHFDNKIVIAKRRGQGLTNIIHSASISISDAIVNLVSYEEGEEDNENFVVDDDIRLRHDDPLIPSYIRRIYEDIHNSRGIEKLDLDRSKVQEIIPDSLTNLLTILVCGCPFTHDDRILRKIESIAQDIIYVESGSRKVTPKHIGLASTIHQKTRSKDILNLLHGAGHVSSYDQVRSLDTMLAESTKSSMSENGAVVPQNLKRGIFTHFTCDNIDMKDESLDGKYEFHGTQYAAWQRSGSGTTKIPAFDMNLDNRKRSVEVPRCMEDLSNARMPAEHVEMPRPEEDTDFFNIVGEDSIKASARDLAFNSVRSRQGDQTKETWTSFNEKITTGTFEMTEVGYMPIIPHKANAYDTLMTVVESCFFVSEDLGQEYTVITVDEPLYCKLMEMKWYHPELRTKLIPRMGGLHISMNFMKVIGQHMESSGLKGVWVESGVLAEGAAEKVMAGKDYNKAMRLHKMTWQALWREFLPLIERHLEESDPEFAEFLRGTDNYDQLSELFTERRFTNALSSYEENEKNLNIKFWFGYVEMVAILLRHTRAQREANWNLHLQSFSEMLPYMTKYDHYNYSRWGPVYLNEMSKLPKSVKEEFLKGNWVVKRSHRNFNQVDPDQAQEWLNGTGKKRGGVIGITRNAKALNRWALSYNLRTLLSDKVYELYDIDLGHLYEHKETTTSRQERDWSDELKIHDMLKKMKVFHESKPDVLLNAFNDAATDEIQNELLNVRLCGKNLVTSFIAKRMEPTSPESLHESIQRNNPKTFSDLYKTSKSKQKVNEEKQVVKLDRQFHRRLIAGLASGRDVSMDELMGREHMPVPLAIAEMNGKLRTANSKSDMINILTNGTECPTNLPVTDKSNYTVILIDGQARIRAMGKPENAITFTDYANEFVRSILSSGNGYNRIDVVFDRYHDSSIKTQTRRERTSSCKTVRRVIEDGTEKLPVNWASFISSNSNKSDLSRFLSNSLIAIPVNTAHVVTAGGFEDERRVMSNVPMSDTELLKLNANHEEADTRLIVHAVNSSSHRIVVHATDTDVFLLLIHHFERIPSEELWLAISGKKKRYIPVHAVANQLSPDLRDNIMAFHSLTGCDTTSQFYGISKASAWEVSLSAYIA